MQEPIFDDDCPIDLVDELNMMTVQDKLDEIGYLDCQGDDDNW